MRRRRSERWFSKGQRERLVNDIPVLVRFLVDLERIVPVTSAAPLVLDRVLGVGVNLFDTGGGLSAAASSRCLPPQRDTKELTLSMTSLMWSSTKNWPVWTIPPVLNVPFW